MGDGFLGCIAAVPGQRQALRRAARIRHTMGVRRSKAPGRAQKAGLETDWPKALAYLVVRIQASRVRGRSFSANIVTWYHVYTLDIYVLQGDEHETYKTSDAQSFQHDIIRVPIGSRDTCCFGFLYDFFRRRIWQNYSSNGRCWVSDSLTYYIYCSC